MAPLCIVHALVFFLSFSANILLHRNAFEPKTICTPRVIIPEKFSSIDAAVSEELRNKQTNKQKNRQT